jgi:hypothetical protein
MLWRFNPSKIFFFLFFEKLLLIYTRCFFAYIFLSTIYL